jgi:hypothetical protein
MTGNARLNSLLQRLTWELGERIEQAAGEPLAYALIVLGTEATDTPPMHIVSNEQADGLLILGDLLREFARSKQAN